MPTSRHLFIMPHLRKWEGGLSRDKDDKASADPCPVMFNGHNDWHTNLGVTWATFKSYCYSKGLSPLEQTDLFFHLTKDDVADIFKELYWDKVHADDVKSHAAANCIAQWAWGSGAGGYVINKKGIGKWVGAMICIRELAAKYCKPKPSNWKMGTALINELHTLIGERDLFDELCKVREKFFKDISPIGSKNAKFLNGWLNRLEAFKKYNQPILPAL